MDNPRQEQHGGQQVPDRIVSDEVFVFSCFLVYCDPVRRPLGGQVFRFSEDLAKIAKC